MFHAALLRGRLLLGALSLALLGGCLLDPVGIIAEPIMYAVAQNATPVDPMAGITAEDLGATPQAYRSYNCEMLANLHQSFEKQKLAADDPRMWQMHLDAISQVGTEKSCPALTSASANSHLSATGAVQTTGQGKLGIGIDVVTAAQAQALGLSSTDGVLVTATEPGGLAEKGGLKAMDVITEITGQSMRTPQDLQATVRRMRPGFKADIRVWRAGQFVDLAIEVSEMTASTAPSPSVASIAPAPTPAPAVATQTQAVRKFCHAYISVHHQLGGVHSTVLENTASTGSSADMLASLTRFVGLVKAAQPGQWKEFDFSPDQCSIYSGYCYANSKGLFDRPKQIAGQFCYASREEAEANVRHFESVDPGITTIAWP